MGKKKKQKQASAPQIVDRGRTPRQDEKVGSEKAPRSEPHVPVPQQKPSWRFNLLDFDGPFCPKSIKADLLLEIHDKLKNFESMTWGEIEGEKHHDIQFDQLGKEAQRRLAELKLEGFGSVFSLRLTGKRRILGPRIGPVMLILWWDPEHQACPSKGADN